MPTTLLRLIVKNIAGTPIFEVASSDPTSLHLFHHPHSPYSLLLLPPPPHIPPIDLSRCLNTRHLKSSDDTHRHLILPADQSSLGTPEDVVRARKVPVKIYQVNEFLWRGGWRLLGSHVESYEGGCICDVHSFVRVGGGGSPRGSPGEKKKSKRRGRKGVTIRTEGEGLGGQGLKNGNGEGGGPVGAEVIEEEWEEEEAVEGLDWAEC